MEKKGSETRPRRKAPGGRLEFVLTGALPSEGKDIEVGNIFQLKTRFSEPFELFYDDADGTRKPVIMRCYGIGPSRVVGTVVEMHSDDKGIRWPKNIAPYLVHLVMLTASRTITLDPRDSPSRREIGEARDPPRAVPAPRTLGARRKCHLDLSGQALRQVPALSR